MRRRSLCGPADGRYNYAAAAWLMPTTDENYRTWNDGFQWPADGDPWSKAWGGAASQWYGTLLPRVREFLPAPTVLEIAPGFGRWTQFLRPLAERLIVVDISPKCIDACKRRFAAHSGIEYHVNNGRSLDMVSNRSVDFVFSFDSLVHVEADILIAYLTEIARALAPEGIGFVHHSNLAEFVDRETGELVAGIDNKHWRATSVSAALAREACAQHGLSCVSQEIVNWGQHLTDVITVVALPHSKWARECIVTRNTEFMREASYLSRLATLYDRADVTGGQR
jgi:SAM-dependent methyltransferase